MKLVVSGQGHVPSFKNSKMLAHGRLITLPERQKWMEQCRESFVSQLSSASQTSADGISTEPCPPSSIASSLPEDDSVNDICELVVRIERVEKGQEGATIEVDRL